MSTFIASLFLPYTIDFHDDEPESQPLSRRPSSKRLHSRAVSGEALKRNVSTASLFTGPAPPLTPVEEKRDEFFQQFNQDPRSVFPKPGNPRAVLRNDLSVPDWGAAAQYLNQPKSRAAPLPSGNILDYVKMEKPVPQKKHHQRRQTGSSKSRRGSHERDFESKSWSVEPGFQGNGGLVNAIRGRDAVEQTECYQKIWVGTLGFPTDALGQDRKEEIHEKLENEYEALTVFPSDRDLDGHYGHYCKTILWPVFHYQIPDHPKSKAYEDHSWEFYRGLNQAFADTIIAGYKRGDIVWVHDYHLLLVPGMIRKALPDAKIGFFLHAAFPSSEVFRCLSARKELLEGMLGANLVAFQTREYAQHFLQTCSRLLTVEANGEGVQLEERFVNVTNQPIGIDPPQMQQLKSEPEVKEWIQVLQERYKGKRLIVSRDKLDNIRGVRQKLLSYELFLNKFPEWRHKVVLIQVATSTTENSDLLATVSDIVTRIDSVHSTLAHQPLVFLKQDISFSQYLALLTCADALMITSLREGMNLTPHEFVLCQDGSSEKKHGPVILSEFTGGAAVFGGNEISVNPWDYQACAKAINTALTMDSEERERRHNKLLSVVMHHTGAYWAACLEEALDKVYKEQYARNAMSIPRLSLTALAENYKSASRRVFILDYEGTLASYGTDTNVALTSPQKVLDALNGLVSDRRNYVYVMSGRTPEELQRLFSKVPSLGLIAENGCFLREYGAPENEWTTFADLESCSQWKGDIRPILQYYCDRVQGSWIEERYCSLVFHYEKAEDPAPARTQAGDCANHINDSCEAYRVQAVPNGKAVLVEQLDWSKGTAATHIFDRLRKKNIEDKGLAMPDFMLVAGDDREDEVIFDWANKKAEDDGMSGVMTVSIGKRNTRAMATLTQGTAGLVSALQKLAKLSSDDDATSSDYLGGRKAAIDAA
ncbi:alpha,alpha-trehalose phosphate synthase-like protein subunit [Delphinella strobiligena]|nr:alpha,alpha-trehalose phosphate synthase-like protein subunit [Delphinella strobiligena]